MSNVEPLKREDLPEFEPQFENIQMILGFVPNSMLTMARWPELLKSFSEFSRVVMTPHTVQPGLKGMVAHIASTASGCRYCQAHTASTSLRFGGAPEKVEALWEFETSSLFDESERAALRLARDGACVPSAVTPAHFAELRKHFNEEQIVEIVSVISLFGWLNRWNDTMATELEPEPLQVSREHLANRGWEVGKHGRG